jgi:hypothetical protein
MISMLDQILPFNLFASTLIFYVAARCYLIPRLGNLPARAVLVPILLLHSMRHLGLMFLSRGAVLPGMPEAFAYPAALGDLFTAILAFASIPAVIGGWTSARPLLWVFNIAGSIDLISAITLATIYQAGDTMGAAWWIPAFWVPSLLVTHYVTFLILGRRPEALAA